MDPHSWRSNERLYRPPPLRNRTIRIQVSSNQGSSQNDQQRSSDFRRERRETNEYSQNKYFGSRPRHTFGSTFRRHDDHLHFEQSKMPDERQKYTKETAYRFKKLEELSEKDPMSIIVEINAHQQGFEQLLDSKLSDDYVVLVIKIFAKVCTTTQTSNKIAIMTIATKDAFHQSFQNCVLHLMAHNSSSDRQRSQYFWKDPNSFFENCAIIFKTIVESIPSRAYEILPQTLTAVKAMLKILFNDDEHREILETFDKMDEALKSCTLKREKKINKNELTGDDDSNIEPPDDFRCLSIYPTMDDIMLDSIFLRKNLIDKGYESVDHYLDVQFRLLKEDFVGPLRDGIVEYKKCTDTYKQVIKCSSARIYKTVRFISQNVTQGQLGMLLQFQSNSQTYAKKKTNFNKRFMYGSLLCFTNDNFQTLLFGKVIGRDIELLQQGQVVVGFEADQDIAFGQSYTMIECSIYFEPYYHVLKAMQNISEEDFPMKRYIIDLDSNINFVSYLSSTSKYLIDNQPILISSLHYSNAISLGLDNTQYAAFQTGLTKEFVVIQGPPGTGKTFLGLKIATTLILNSQYWHKSSPILIVCYTNHALDQFLEGLQTTTLHILRVGGQSKNKNMEKFSLREKRRQFRNFTNNKALREIEANISKKLSQIGYWNDLLKSIESNSGIIGVKMFMQIDSMISSSWFYQASDEDVIEWLLGGTNAEERRLERNKIKHKQLKDNILDKEDELEEQFDEVLYNQMKEERMIDDGMNIETKSSSGHYLISVQELKSKIEKIKDEENEEIEEHLIYNKRLELQEKRFGLEDKLEYLQMRLDQYRHIEVQYKPQNCNFQNPHFMAADDRWQLYFYWLEQYKQYITNILKKDIEKYKIIQEQYQEIKDIFDFQIMEKMLVVGMTTTGAARYQNYLKKLKCPIVMVEEAAEVLESHVVVSLTSACKHLILIGDHQQLRPSTSNYYIERHYNLGISLFERMVRNKLQCHVLGVQHRMRPQIARLIVPAIYPKLENHSSVYDFPSITGVVPNLFFINHEFKEEESGDSSKLNNHEARFLIALARYLVQNGYEPEHITILAAYSAQMFTLWKEQRKCFNLLEGVKITVLDNYQGEENKIILLSLVRNNDNDKIGFLKIENRVCVALSRAREGFYIMGNMDLLCRNSDIWPKIKSVLETQDCLGPSLLLRCQVHPNQETRVRLPQDFNNVAEGGCNKVCNTLLKCSHYCSMLCHSFDRKHENIQCKADCTKILCENDHRCPDLCFKPCLPCNVPMQRILECTHKHVLPCHININMFKCTTPVKTRLLCGHIDPKKPCHYPIDSYKCPFPCDTRVEPCGHACTKLCHTKDDPDHITYKCEKPCTKASKGCSTGKHKCSNKCYENCNSCEIVIEKKRSCTHKVNVPCQQNPDEVICIYNCKRILPCGHACRKKCCQPCGDCNVMVNKELSVCGHKIAIKCSETPSRNLCNEKCPLLLPCGHACEQKCNEPCTISCKNLVSHTKSVACDHTFEIECHMLEKEYSKTSFDLLKFCGFPCRAVLKCNHACSGTCGECAQGRIHRVCAEKCEATLVCGHPCPISCRDACQPCIKNCSYRCQHSTCKKKCGEPCTTCKEKCTRKCPHVECTTLCGDLCTAAPCEKPCTKKLPCGHSCIGFCGDPCPNLCRICNYDELITKLYDYKGDDDNARFVMLDECKHIIESKTMQSWITQEDHKKVVPKCCPLCSTILTSTQRYSDYIKKSFLNLSKVKEKYFGTNVENENHKKELVVKLQNLRLAQAKMNGTLFEKCLEKIEKAFNSKNKPVNLMLFTIYLSKLEITENIVKVYKNENPRYKEVIEYVNFLFTVLMRNDKRISQQEISDFEKEIKRLSQIVEVLNIRTKYLAVLKASFETNQIYSNTLVTLFSTVVFSSDVEDRIAKNMHRLSQLFNYPLTKIELNQVLQPLRMATGRWFICPKGHVYAVRECYEGIQVDHCTDCAIAIHPLKFAPLP